MVPPVPPVPPFKTLRPLKAVAGAIGLSLTAAHRWRLDPYTPLHAWKIGREWMTTEEAAADFIRRRTERWRRAGVSGPRPPASSGPPAAPTAPGLVLGGKRRRRRHEAAKASNAESEW